MTDDEHLVFEQSDSIRQQGLFMLLGGGAAIAWAMVGFVMAMIVNVSQFSLHAMTTLPVLLAINLISSGWKKRKGAQRVVLSQKGILVESSSDSQFTLWSGLAFAKVETVGMAQQKTLRIYDAAGKVAIEIAPSVDNFDDLSQAVIKKVGDQQPEVATQVGKSTTRRNAVAMLAAAVLIGAAVIFLTIDQRRESEAAELLSQQGQPATARITEHFTAPNGRTLRIKYQVTPEGPEENVEVDPVTWATLQGAQEVGVLTVPGRPDISRLVAGQVPDGSDLGPLEQKLLLIGGGGFSLVMLVFGLFSWFGWDVSIDDTTKKMKLTRYGRPV